MIVQIWTGCWFSWLAPSLDAIFTDGSTWSIPLGRADSPLSEPSLLTVLIRAWYSSWFPSLPERCTDSGSRLSLHISDRISVITPWTRSSINYLRSFNGGSCRKFPLLFDEFFVRSGSVVGGRNYRVVIVWGILDCVVYSSNLHVISIWGSWPHSETPRTSTWSTIFHYFVRVVNCCKVFVIPLSAHRLGSLMEIWFFDKFINFHNWALVLHQFKL